jgi:uncharacterized protein
MRIELEPLEARVIGCLIEKQITTPDQYPLSLNALVSACNQKSNRDPVLELEESTVQRTVDALARKHLVIEKSGFGSRVPKYQHRFCNTEYGPLKFSPQELALVCELLLRGAQTPGELRSRASRMAPFADVEALEQVLEQLVQREDGPFVRRLAREPGRRESRYCQLFSVTPSEAAAHEGAALAPAAPDPGRHEAATARAASIGTASSAGILERLEQLEAQVKALRAELERLRAGR